MLAWSVYILGTVLAAQGDERASQCFEESLRVGREGDFHLVTGSSLRQLGALALRDGRDGEAADRLVDAFDHFAKTGDFPQVWDVLRTAAPLLVRRGRRALAAETLAGADADSRARRPAPLEAGGIEELRVELEPELSRVAGAARTLDDLGPAVREELRRFEGEAPASASAAPTQAASGAAFFFEGALWTLSFEGTTVHMPDLKGLHDLARLVAAPEEDLHCLELAGAPSSGTPVAADGDRLNLQGDAGELLDERGKAEYRRRIQDLREETERAQAANDTVRAERAREELDQLTDALSAAFGLGGRARKAGDPAERARTTVTWRIRSAVGKIEEVHPSVGRHLRNSVRTGVFCAYRPERPVDWRT